MQENPVETMPPNVTELVAGRIYAVSGFVSSNLDASWIAPSLAGQLAVSCYLLRDGDSALIVDTGLAVHREAIAAGLEPLLAGTVSRSLVMTRREPDSIINLPWLVKCFPIDAIYCGGAISPLDFFERVDEQSAEAHVNAIAQSNLTWLRPGDGIAVGRLSVDMLRTRLCALPKTHFYERQTRTLFASDSWGSLTQAGGGRMEVVAGPDPRLGRDPLAGYIRYKFDWLLGIDTSAIADDVAALAELPVERICPSYGSVIEGADLCRDVIEETAEAIRMLAWEPMIDRLRGVDLKKLSAAAA